MDIVFEGFNNNGLYVERSEYAYSKMLKFHTHDKHELYFLEQGTTKYFIGNKIYILNPGDLIFIPSGQYHQTDINECEKRERLLLTFDNAFVGSGYIKYIQELILDKHIHIPTEYMNDLKYILKKIEEEDKNKLDEYQNMQKMYLRQLLVLITRNRIKRQSIEISKNDKLVQEAAEYISKNYGQELCLENLANKYFVSPGHFSKMFKRITGVGVSEYIRIARVNAAQDLIESSKLSISEIAYQCGFNDSNYFTQVFKKIKGITPKKYSMQVNNYKIC